MRNSNPIGVGDVTSPIVVLKITDFGNDWGRGHGIASVGREAPAWQVNPHFHYRGEQRDRDPLEAQSDVGEGGGEGPNIPEGLRQEIREG